MNEDKKENFYLKKGTNLDDRYEIIRVLGMGGFGITYEAVNRRVQLRVAIKEYFFLEYMTRNVSVSDEIQLYSDSDAERLKKEKKHFIREARIVSDFHEEPGIAHVTDYFEANGTAYIVMEYLDGTTLHEYQMRNGTFTPESIGVMMIPLMQTLQKIHEAGVLHRDISPDNIMVMKDGTLRLMDFGAAGSLDSSADEVADYQDGVEVKDGYTPIEQYGSSGKQGPWTDVYALAATMYTCITGLVPESSIQRSVYDDLKKPSEIGIKIVPRLEQILLKGLEVKPTNRFQSMQEFLDCMQTALPNKQAGKRKSRALIAAAIVTAALAAGGIWWGYVTAHFAKYKFHGEETVVIHVSAPEDMSAQDYFANKKILKQRVEVLAGVGGYLWTETDDDVQIVVPQKIFGADNINEDVEQYLTAPWRLELRVINYNADGTYSMNRLTSFNQERDLADLRHAENNLAELHQGSVRAAGQSSEESAVSYEGQMSEKLAVALSDVKADYFAVYSDEVYSKDYADGWDSGENEVMFFDRNGKGTVENTEVSEEMMPLYLWDISHKPMSEALEGFCEPDVQWETVENNVLRGESQKDSAELPEDTEVLEYRYNKDNGRELTGAEKTAAMAVFKERLDACKRPYAFGISKSDESVFYIMAEEDDFPGIEALVLGSDSVTVSDLDVQASNWGTEETADGSIVLTCTPADEQWVADNSAGAAKVQKLTLGNVNLATGWPEDSEKKIVFSQINLQPWMQEQGHLNHLAGLLNGMSIERISDVVNYRTYEYTCAWNYDRTEGKWQLIGIPDLGIPDEVVYRDIMRESEKSGGRARMIDLDTPEIYYGDLDDEDLIKRMGMMTEQICGDIDSSRITQDIGSIRLIFEGQETFSDRCVVEIGNLNDVNKEYSLSIWLNDWNNLSLKRQLLEYEHTHRDFWADKKVKLH